MYGVASGLAVPGGSNFGYVTGASAGLRVIIVGLEPIRDGSRAGWWPECWSSSRATGGMAVVQLSNGRR